MGTLLTIDTWVEKLCHDEGSTWKRQPVNSKASWACGTTQMVHSIVRWKWFVLKLLLQSRSQLHACCVLVYQHPSGGHSLYMSVYGKRWRFWLPFSWLERLRTDVNVLPFQASPHYWHFLFEIVLMSLTPLFTQPDFGNRSIYSHLSFQLTVIGIVLFPIMYSSYA